jgi:hypothetical protein
VVVPLAVEMLLNEPHVFGGVVGVQLQVTPALAGSFDAVAATVVVPEIAIVAGGGVVIKTEIAGGGGVVMVIGELEALLVLSVTEVAVKTTLLGVGTVLGAVYVVFAPLAVEVGLNVPQEFAGVQLQVTPALALSFVTFADTP